MQRRILCAASDDIVINFRVQLLNDGTVIVLRDAAAHKEEDALEFVRSSFFDLSENGVRSHVWMSQVGGALQPTDVLHALLHDSTRSNHLLGCSCVKATMELFLSCR